LRHNQEVLWKRDVGGHPRIGRIGADDEVVVVPLAFGYKPNSKRPTAAYMRIEKAGQTLEGIVPLKVGGRSVSVRPLPNQ